MRIDAVTVIHAVIIGALLGFIGLTAADYYELDLDRRVSHTVEASDPARRGFFYKRVDEGAGCVELFKIRNAHNFNSPSLPQIDEELYRIGCYGSSLEAAEPSTPGRHQ